MRRALTFCGAVRSATTTTTTAAAAFAFHPPSVLPPPRQSPNAAAAFSLWSKRSDNLVRLSALVGEDYFGVDDLIETDEDSGHELYWLDDDGVGELDDDDILYGINDDDDVLFGDDSDSSSSLGQSIGEGRVVMCLPNVAHLDECDHLFEAALSAVDERATGTAARGRSRFSVSDPAAFSNDVVVAAEEILLRVLDYLDERVPSVYEWLFRPDDPEWAGRQPLDAQLEQPTVNPDPFLAETCEGLRDLYMAGALEWSEGEPAINVYEPGGHFGAHKDHLALTVLIPLTAPSEDFEGGGTGFWAGNRRVDENPSSAPSLVLKPEPGSALLFGGDVTHAGLNVESGLRSVLVCSFSTVTPASSPDRLHGLQAPPKVSANFKGTI